MPAVSARGRSSSWRWQYLHTSRHSSGHDAGASVALLRLGCGLAAGQVVHVLEEEILPGFGATLEGANLVHEVRVFQRVLRRGGDYVLGIIQRLQDFVYRLLATNRVHVDLRGRALIIVDEGNGILQRQQYRPVGDRVVFPELSGA